jgi:hypothetical protein
MAGSDAARGRSGARRRSDVGDRTHGRRRRSWPRRSRPGLLVTTAGERVLRLLPPLVIRADEIDEGGHSAPGAHGEHGTARARPVVSSGLEQARESRRSRSCATTACSCAVPSPATRGDPRAARELRRAGHAAAAHAPAGLPLDPRLHCRGRSRPHHRLRRAAHLLGGAGGGRRARRPAGRQGTGLGRRAVETLVHDARALGLQRVFALTLQDRFFHRLGFETVAISEFPEKVAADCSTCSRRATCAEIAVA